MSRWYWRLSCGGWAFVRDGVAKGIQTRRAETRRGSGRSLRSPVLRSRIRPDVVGCKLQAVPWWDRCKRKCFSFRLSGSAPSALRRGRDRKSPGPTPVRKARSLASAANTPRPWPMRNQRVCRWIGAISIPGFSGQCHYHSTGKCPHGRGGHAAQRGVRPWACLLLNNANADAAKKDRCHNGGSSDRAGRPARGFPGSGGVRHADLPAWGRMGGV